jgi:ABC-type transporter Mla MlaB component
MSQQSPATPLHLGGAFSIEHAAELQAHLLAALPTASSLCLAQISEIDCAGLQLLLAARQQYPQLPWHTPSAAVSELLSRLQLSHLLSD